MSAALHVVGIVLDIFDVVSAAAAAAVLCFSRNGALSAR